MQQSICGINWKTFLHTIREQTCLLQKNPSSSYAHLLNETHPFGPIQDTMQILHHHRKGPHLNTIERFHIYTEYMNGSHLNDEHTIFPNKIFESLIKPGCLQN